MRLCWIKMKEIKEIIYEVIYKTIRNDIDEHHMNVIVPEGNAAVVMEFLHKSLLCPPTSILLKVIKNRNLVKWPMLTDDNTKKHDPKLGNLDQKRKISNLQRKW